ncbi:MAG: ParB N-terminal domain-containing protein [Promicromonosporaceae bacterium]|nr:ParB N-terminal domain-containing protein [Promicromonosporaceae bacterium]
MREQTAYPTEIRPLDEIRVADRRRRSLGNIDGLAASIEAVGLINPPLVSADGVLLCGARRLAAVRELGWRQIEVRVHPDASGTLSAALAEQQENGQRLDLLPTEEARLYVELKPLYQADAAERQAASRFGHPTATGPGEDDSPGPHGAQESSGPRGPNLTSRQKASLAITGKLSFQRLDQIAKIIAVTEDPATAWHVRKVAEGALTAIDERAPVDPHYRTVMAALTLANLSPDEPTAPDDVATPGPVRPHLVSDEDVAEMAREAERVAKARRAAEQAAAAKRRLAAQPVRRSVRALYLSMQDLDGITRHYDLDQVAHDLSDREWDLVCRVESEWHAFITAITEVRAALAADPTRAEAV